MEKINNIPREELKSMINKMSEKAIKNQVDQIINYNSNSHDGYLPLLSLFENCSIVINEYLENKLNGVKELKEIKNIEDTQGKIDTKELKEIKSIEDIKEIIDINKLIDIKEITKDTVKEFEKSLNNSKECILNSELYLEKLKGLKKDNSQSFILAPVCSKMHLFTTAIYKKDSNYEFILINKGGRYDPESNKLYNTYEKYIIPSKDEEKLKYLVSLLNNYNSRLSTIEIYNEFEECSIREERINEEKYEAREQRTGNCYYKEIEAGLKYVFAYAFDYYETRTYEDESYYKFGNTKFGVHINKVLSVEKTPKYPEGTEIFQKKLLNNIKELYGSKEIEKYIDDVSDAYSRNKKFRKMAVDKLDDLEKMFYKVFGEGIENTGDLEYIKKCLKKVDDKTLHENMDFFIGLLRKNNIYVPIGMYKAVLNHDRLDFEANFEGLDIEYNNFMREDFNKNKTFYKEFFPLVAKKIENNINLKYYKDVLIEVNMAIENEKYEYSEKILLKALEKDVDNLFKAKVYGMLGNIYERQLRYNKASEVYENAYELLEIENNNLKELYENKCKKMLQNVQMNKKRLSEIDEEIQSSNNVSDYNLIKEKANIERSIGNLEEAIKLYDEVYGNIDDIYSDIDKNCIEKLDIMQKKESVLKEIGKEKELSDIQNEIMEYCQSDELDHHISAETEARVIEVLGDELIKMGNKEEAVLYYDEALIKIEEILTKLEADGNLIPENYNLYTEKAMKLQTKIYNVDNFIEREDLFDIFDNNIEEDYETYQDRIKNENEEVIKRYYEKTDNDFDLDEFKQYVNACRIINRSEEVVNYIDKYLNSDEYYTNLEIKMAKEECLMDSGEEEKLKKALDECRNIERISVSSDDIIGINIKNQSLMNKGRILRHLGKKKDALAVYARLKREHNESTAFKYIYKRLLDEELGKNNTAIKKEEKASKDLWGDDDVDSEFDDDIFDDEIETNEPMVKKEEEPSKDLWGDDDIDEEFDDDIFEKENEKNKEKDKTKDKSRGGLTL